jgi:hypothetical protein
VRDGHLHYNTFNKVLEKLSETVRYHPLHSRSFGGALHAIHDSLSYYMNGNMTPHTHFHFAYLRTIFILHRTIHIPTPSSTSTIQQTVTTMYSAKSTDEFNDFMSYLSGKPLPPPRTETPPTVAPPPARAAPARQSSTVTVANPVTTHYYASSTNKKSSTTTSSSTLDEISLAHLHFNPKLRSSIRA